MELIETQLKDVYLIKPKVFHDNRGFFLETYSLPKLEKLGIKANFVQDNHSFTMQKGVIRGMHFQKHPHAQAKLVRVLHGAVLDVALDLRKDSPTFLQWQGFELTEENFMMLFIPRGFAHGFCTLRDNTDFVYKNDNVYQQDAEGGIRWNDPGIKIDWPVQNPALSEKDKNWPVVTDWKSFF